MSINATLKFIWNHPLNRGNRAGALGRFARWQFASRLLSGPIALPFVEKTHLFVSRGMTGATGNWYCGLHELSEMAFVLHLLRPDDLFVDIGANIGSYTVLAAGAVGAKVISVEPIPDTFKVLQGNVALNGLQELVELHCIGLSDQEGVLKFSDDLDTVNHVLADAEEAPSVKVAVRSLDRLLEGQSPIMLKLDVEGYEIFVLKGGEKTLAAPELLAIVMETNQSGRRYGITDDSLFEYLNAFGFAPYSYDPFARRLLSQESSSGNTIFIKHKSRVDDRIASSKHYRLVNGQI